MDLNSSSLVSEHNHSLASTYLPKLQSPVDAGECFSYPVLVRFGRGYGQIHGYVALILCPLGVLSNIFNVIVLNQPSMISPINFLLTALAVCDGLLMTSYIPFAAYFVVGKRMTSSSYGWAIFLLVHINLQNLLHSASSNIVVVLASFRVLYVRYLIKCQELCSMRRAQLSVVIALTVSTLLTIPCAVSHHIVQKNVDDGEHLDPDKSYMVTYIDNQTLIDYLYWNTAIFIKLLPLVALTILSLIIIVTIKKRNAKMRRLKRPQPYCSALAEVNSGVETNGRKFSTQQESNSVQKDQPLLQIAKPNQRQSDSLKRTSSLLSSRQTNSMMERDKMETRMTRLLLTVVLIFMIALLPQAILLFLNGFLGHCFTETVYNSLGDFTDLLTIMNNGINFVLYCAMSQQFRVAFLQLFCPWTQLGKKYSDVSLRNTPHRGSNRPSSSHRRR